MFWMIPVALVAVAGKLIYDAVTDDTPPASPRQPLVLERNFSRLRDELAQTSGPRIAVLGQPGAGKSSLLRKISNQQMRPLPVVGAHTNATNWADSPSVPLLSHWQGMVFADVPGYDTASHPVATYTADFPFHRFDRFVLVLNGKLHAADAAICQKLRAQGKPLLLVRSFADGLDDDEFHRAQTDVRQYLHCDPEVAVVLASNRSGVGVAEVLVWLQASSASTA